MKRFWKDVTVEPAEGGWQVALDGRRVRTQGGQPQVVQSRALAELLAAEWSAQGEEIDPAAFAHRDMADYAIDMVASGEEDIVAKLIGFLDTDTLCYRADPDEPLYRRQQNVWDPLLAALEEDADVRIERVSGILHRPQPPETVAALRRQLEALDPFTIAAVFSLTSLAASLVVGLSALEDGADPVGLWDAANLEEDWQIENWGADDEAATRRARRLGDFTRAVEFARAARS